jgi:hypothetical protein
MSALPDPLTKMNPNSGPKVSDRNSVEYFWRGPNSNPEFLESYGSGFWGFTFSPQKIQILVDFCFVLFLKVWWHAATLFLFIFTLIEQTYNILYIVLVEHHSCCPHCFPLGRGPPQGCRAEIRTRACRTASLRATIWATPHPEPHRTLTPHRTLMSHTAPCDFLYNFLTMYFELLTIQRMKN